MPTTAPAFPLVIEESGGFFGQSLLFKNFSKYKIQDHKQLLTFHLKNIILTNPGERIWNADFGVGIQRYLFIWCR